MLIIKKNKKKYTMNEFELPKDRESFVEYLSIHTPLTVDEMRKAVLVAYGTQERFRMYRDVNGADVDVCSDCYDRGAHIGHGCTVRCDIQPLRADLFPTNVTWTKYMSHTCDVCKRYMWVVYGQPDPTPPPLSTTNMIRRDQNSEQLPRTRMAHASSSLT